MTPIISEINLSWMDLTSTEFESLVSNLFQKFGLETKLTRSTAIIIGCSLVGAKAANSQIKRLFRGNSLHLGHQV